MNIFAKLVFKGEHEYFVNGNYLPQINIKFELGYIKLS